MSNLPDFKILFCTSASSAGKHVILVVVDRLSKYAHFLALAHPYIALDVSQLFLDQILKLHDLPSSITSERGPIFLSEVWTKCSLCKVFP